MNYRISRLFDPESGRCLNVALDHGMFGESSFLTGIEDMPSTVEVIARAAPDAIQLSPGMAPLLAAIPNRHKPALVMRTDVANVYGSPLPRALFSLHVPDAIERALRLDAACVVANLLELPNEPDVSRQCIASIVALRAECDRYGMPLMVEPLVMRRNEDSGGYQVDGDTQKIVALVRQARELGADIIKADPTTNLDEYPQIIQTAAGVPVLVRGGGRVPDAEILRRTERVVAAGARGIVYGRNIIQHPNPDGITRALMAVVHREIPVDTAMTLIEGDA